ncbi:hypothetical protein CCM_03418 [Cordyceps militaris CM01]|uniref:Uncharacterized protein n=1 Tax=Cordyceps militaris (strain CM01) TaxID=983644 RepID=G3JAN1_CORMM|nr:uncharacterized protein CCM_03418 [Cordyceps militaris CM01]EGX95146.1 hypothetical protein CCM_03418 [Cordyceps militaris CM01]
MAPNPILRFDIEDIRGIKPGHEVYADLAVRYYQTYAANMSLTEQHLYVNRIKQHDYYCWESKRGRTWDNRIYRRMRNRNNGTRWVTKEIHFVHWMLCNVTIDNNDLKNKIASAMKVANVTNRMADHAEYVKQHPTKLEPAELPDIITLAQIWKDGKGKGKDMDLTETPAKSKGEKGGKEGEDAIEKEKADKETPKKVKADKEAPKKEDADKDTVKKENADKEKEGTGVDEGCDTRITDDLGYFLYDDWGSSSDDSNSSSSSDSSSKSKKKNPQGSEYGKDWTIDESTLRKELVKAAEDQIKSVQSIWNIVPAIVQSQDKKIIQQDVQFRAAQLESQQQKDSMKDKIIGGLQTTVNNLSLEFDRTKEALEEALEKQKPLLDKLAAHELRMDGILGTLERMKDERTNAPANLKKEVQDAVLTAVSKMLEEARGVKEAKRAQKRKRE